MSDIIRTSMVGSLILLVTIACRHSDSGQVKSEANRIEPRIAAAGVASKFDRLFDLNDVSMLMKSPTRETRDQYIGLDAKTSEGPLLTKMQFDKLGPMLKQTRLLPYGEWKLSALRIDNCGKILPQLPCLPQIRLVFQPLWSGQDLGPVLNKEVNPAYKEFLFGDEAIHMAFDVGPRAVEMYQDFLNLKDINVRVSTKGTLDEHPVLAAEGMNGPYAKQLHKLVLKYALPSTLDRIAIMGTRFGGFTARWEFAATTEIKNGDFVQSPLPCQLPTDRTNIFEMLPNPAATQGKPFTTPSSGCSDTDITELLLDPQKAGDNALTQRALRIENPELTAFASTNCASCHKTNRLLQGLKEEQLNTIKAKTKDAFKDPKGVSNTMVSSGGTNFGAGTWEVRAFGWNEDGGGPGISRFTLNDSMRVADQLNKLIREGALK